MIVKIDLPAATSSPALAVIRADDGCLTMTVEPHEVAKRFRPGERSGFFSARIDADGFLEIGERVVAEPW